MLDALLALSVTHVALLAVWAQCILSVIAEVVPGGTVKKSTSILILVVVAAAGSYVITATETGSADAERETHARFDAIQAGQGDTNAMARYMANQRALMDSMTEQGAKEFGKLLESVPEKVRERAEMNEAGNRLAGPLLVRWGPVQEWIVMNFDKLVATAQTQGYVVGAPNEANGPLLVHDQPAGRDTLRTVVLSDDPHVAIRLQQHPARFDGGQLTSGLQLGIAFYTPRSSDTLVTYELDGDRVRVSANEILAKRGIANYETRAVNPMQEVGLRDSVQKSVEQAVWYAVVEARSAAVTTKGAQQ